MVYSLLCLLWGIRFRLIPVFPRFSLCQSFLRVRRTNLCAHCHHYILIYLKDLCASCWLSCRVECRCIDQEKRASKSQFIYLSLTKRDIIEYVQSVTGYMYGQTKMLQNGTMQDGTVNRHCMAPVNGHHLLQKVRCCRSSSSSRSACDGSSGYSTLFPAATTASFCGCQERKSARYLARLAF